MQSLTVSGQRIEYEFLGDGPLVVLVNNPMVVSDGQRLMAEPLVKAGRRVLVFENHGPDSKTVSEYVTALGGLLDALELKSVCLYGWSLGAVVIQGLAAARPDLASRIVLLATGCTRTMFTQLIFQASRESFAPGVPAGGSNIRSVIWALGQWPASMLANDAVATTLTANSTPQDTFLRGIPEDMGAGLEALATITAATIVIGFELDMLIPAHLGREVANAIKGARYVELPGAAHGAPFTHTRQIMELVLPFLNE